MEMSDIPYFEKYKKGLDDFLYTESLNLSVKQYMEIVKETKRVMLFIEMIKTENNEEK